MREAGSKFQNLHFFSTEYVLIMKQQEKEVLATSPWSTHGQGRGSTSVQKAANFQGDTEGS